MSTIIKYLPAKATSGSDYGISLAKGDIPGAYSFTKFGRSELLNSGGSGDVWLSGGIYTGQPVSLASEIVTVGSSSADDTPAGPGAWTVSVKGLKLPTSTVEDSEIVTMNGVSLVETTNAWWRLNRLKVLTAGASGNNLGTISAAHKITTVNKFAGVSPGFNQSQIAAWTVPAESNAILKRVRIGLARANGSNGSATVTIRVRDVSGVYRAIRAFELTTGAPVDYEAFAGDVLSAGADIKVSVEDVSDNSSIIESALEIYVYAV